MTTIRNTVVRADGTPVAGVRVLVYPVVPTDSPLRPHYPATDPTTEEEILLGGETLTDAAGDWTMDVEPSTALEPIGSVAYRVVQYPPGSNGVGAFDRIVIVPDSAAALWVPDLEELDPDDVTALGPLDAHAGDTDNVHGIRDTAALVEHDGTLLVGGLGQVKSLSPPTLEHLDPAAIGTLTIGGSWDVGTAYDERVVVTHAGAVWASTAATVAGEEPGVDPVWVQIPTAVIDDQGLEADRPAPGIAGRVYSATDTTRSWRDDGDRWHLVGAGNMALEPTPLKAVEIDGAATVIPIDYLDGKLWGRTGNDLYSSTDMGQTWSLEFTGPAQADGLIMADDGEVLLLNTGSSGGVYRSTGWAANPATATWALVVEPNGGPSAYFLRWGFDGDGTNFIVVEYTSTRTDSRLVQISQDGGVTWSTARDTSVAFPASHTESHHHAATVDPWSELFWYSEGHGGPYGIYYAPFSDPTNWTRLAGDFDPEPSPTVMVATDRGIVCGSDAAPNGIYVIRRTDDPADMRLELAWDWRSTRSGLIGFADRGVRDPETGDVYIGFRSNHAGIEAVIAASDGLVAGKVWTDTVTATAERVWNTVVAEGRLAAHVSGGRVLTAELGIPGTQPAHLHDTGNVLGGAIDDQTSVAVGHKADTLTALRSVAIGINASTGGSDAGVAIGHNADTDAAFAVAIGEGAKASTSAVVIGQDAVAAGIAWAVVIGQGASATSTGAVVIGRGSTGHNDGIAIGPGSSGATATGARAIAIGYGANADNESVAIGDAANATGVAFGVAIGNGVAITGTGGVAVGMNATAHVGSVALGRDAAASTGDAVAIGYQASAAHTSSVALGKGATTSTTSQVAIGPRHFEMNKIGGTDIPNPGASKARLFIADAFGDGKLRLRVRFPTGTSQTIAVEP